MNGEDIINYCLAKKGAYLDFPFGDGYAVVKIKTLPKRNGYVFAEVFELKGEEKFTFSTSAEDAVFLRESSEGAVVRGWHCPPVQARYKSTATVDRARRRSSETVCRRVVYESVRKTDCERKRRSLIYFPCRNFSILKLVRYSPFLKTDCFSVTV